MEIYKKLNRPAKVWNIMNLNNAILLKTDVKRWNYKSTQLMYYVLLNVTQFHPQFIS